MHGISPKRIAGFAALMFLLILAAPGNTQQGEEFTITITTNATVDAGGNGHVQGTMAFNPPRGYDRVKRIYPNLYVLFRDLGPERSNFEISKDTLKINSDDAQRAILFSADLLGAAVCKNDRWQVMLGPNEQVSMQDANKISTVEQLPGGSGVKLLGLSTYVLPARAQNVKVDRDAHQLTYTLVTARAAAPTPPPQLDVSVRYRQRLMSAVYKVYGDINARGGAYWAAKTIVRNTGKSPIYDLKVYYHLGEFSEMSVPDTYSVVPPGGAVVDPYYPVIMSKVAEFKTTTPVQLYIKYEYRDAGGRAHSEEMTKRVEILGINQFEFSNLNDQDRTDSWFDYFNNAPLLAAFVTRLDDPVKQFAGYASHLAGGAAAASDDNSAVKWLNAAYTLELANDIVYSTPSGFLTNDHSSGQDIKYPRDVFRDKSGTCVDLAITYAALAETVGLKANLMMVPGHAFPVIRLPGGDLLPVESTGLGGGNQRMTFEQAVDAGKKELQKYLQDGLFFFVNVEDEWNSQRVPNPELAQLGTDFLAKSGIRPPSELAAFSGGGGTGGMGGPAGGAPTQGVGVTGRAVGPTGQNLGAPYRVVHDHGMGNLTYYCVGTLYLSGDMVTYVADRSNDGRNDRFQIRRSDIKEARKNKLPMGQSPNLLEGFHIRLQNGTNYNFARIDDQGRGLNADDVLLALSQQ
jgi:hypothetical protein